MQLAAVVLAAGLFAAISPAQTRSVDLDPNRTRITFELGDVLHTVQGTFRLKSGRFQIDSGHNQVTGQAVVDAASGESGSAARDSRMKKNILETDRYPEIVFTPTAFSGAITEASSSAVTVTGWFSIHGEKHELSLPLSVKLAGNEVTATGHFLVPYVKWGMKNPSTFILRVNQEVAVDVFAVGRIQQDSR